MSQLIIWQTVETRNSTTASEITVTTSTEWERLNYKCAFMVVFSLYARLDFEEMPD